jgi:sugar/nucleoside kinase (ribokinase family)
VDCSSVALLQDFGIERFEQWLQAVRPTVVFANADEGALLDLKHPERITVLKNGPEPVVITDVDGTTHHVNVPSVENVVDTTGAGDAFAAAFILALTRNDAVTVAAEAGIRAASRVLQNPGCSLQS